MTSVSSKRLRELFAELLEVPEEEREQWYGRLAEREPQMVDALKALIVHDAAPFAPLRIPDNAEGPRALQGNSAMPDKVGSYEILAQIGRGGMGVVYRARQLSPERQVALKLIRPGLHGEQMRQRFAREVRVLGVLDHPGVVRIFEAGVCNLGNGPQPFLTMELVDGSDMRSAPKSASFEHRCEWIARVADALQHAHEQGIVHRDIKPENVMLTRTLDATGIAQPKLLDFGIARSPRDEVASDPTLTRAGSLVGTLSYMSPEQMSSGVVSPCSDVYSLGVVLYELFAGVLPLDLRTTSLTKAVEQLQCREPRPLRRIDSKLPSDLEIVAQKAMAKDPDMRYGSAADFAADLRRVARREPIAARRTTTWYQLRRFAERNRALAASLIGLLLVLLGGTTITLIYAADAGRSAARASKNEADAKENAALAKGEAERALAEALRADLRGYAGQTMAASARLRSDSHTTRAMLAATDPKLRGFEYSLMMAALEPAERLVAVKGPRDGAYRPDGTATLAHAEGNVVTVREAFGQQVLLEHEAPGAVELVFLSPDARKVGLGLERAGGILRRLIVVSVDDGRVLFDGQSPTAHIRDLAFSPDGRHLLTRYVGSGLPLHCVDLTNGTWQSLPFAKGESAVASFLPRQGHFQIYGYRYRIEALERTPYYEHFSGAIAGSPAGRFVAGTNSRQRIVYLDDQLSGLAPVAHVGHQARIESLQWTRSGSMLMSASRKASSIIVSDPHDGEVVRRHHIRWVTDAPPTLHPTGETVLVNTPRGVEELPVTRSTRVLGPMPSYLLGVAFSPDGALLGCSDTMGRIQFWDANEGTQFTSRTARLTSRRTQANGIAFDADGLTVHVIGPWVRHYTVDVATGENERTDGADHLLPDRDSPLWRDLAPGARLTRAWVKSHDGRWLSGRNARRQVPFLWSEHYSRVQPPVDVDAPWIKRLTTAKWEAIASAKAEEMREGEIAAIIKGLETAKYKLDQCVAFDRESTRIAIGHRSGIVLIISLENGELLRAIDAHTGPALALAFTPDGRLLSGGLDGIVSIWDAESGNRLAMFEEHERAIECIAVSPDGTRFATASADGTIRLWDTMPLWQRRGEAEQIRAMEESVADRVAQELATSGPRQALRAIWTDEGLSLRQRQAARRLILRR